MKNPHYQTGENKLCPCGCLCSFSNDGVQVCTNVNVDSFTKLHEEDGSSIVDGGQLPY